MLDELKRLLDVLAEHCDPAARRESVRRHMDALAWRPVDRPPVVCNYPLPPDCPFQPFPRCEAFLNPEKMLYNELLCGFSQSIFLQAEVGDDLPWTVRPDFGTILVASLYGAPVSQQGNENAWASHFESREAFDRALDRDPLELRGEFVDRALECYARYDAILSQYPVLHENIYPVLPDLQGPLDNAVLLRGSDFFLELLTDPDAATEAMRRMAISQAALAKKFEPFTRRPAEGYSFQHGFEIRGNILIRCDSSIMLSGEVYRDLVAPWDGYVLREMGGGGIHSCGGFDHIVPHMLAIPDLCCIDFGQSWFNQVESIYRQAREKKIPLIRITRSPGAIADGEAARDFPTGCSFWMHAPDFATARRNIPAPAGIAQKG